MEPVGTDSNVTALKNAGLIPMDYDFPAADREILESLSPQEVQELINIGNKLGRDFLLRYGGGETVGILF